MLDEGAKNQVKEYFEKIQTDVSLQLKEGDHPSRGELISFLEEIVSLHPRLSLVHGNEKGSGVDFSVLKNGVSTGIVFSGVPGGHEFSSLVLAILQAGGNPLKLEEGMQKALRNIEEDLQFETYVSLDCHNCPEVVQALNSFALINPNIKNRMIDGALFPDQVKEKNIQGVPAVYLNGQRFLSGKAESSAIFDKLMEMFPPKQSSSGNIETIENKEVYDVTVIGGGPAGVTSAVYSARKGLKVLMIADRVGGQVRDTMGIENMISLPYTTGPELSNTLLSQLENHNISKKENVKVQKIEDGVVKKIVLNTGEVIQTKTVILSTGAKWRELNVPGEKENIGRGVAYCPHCDGPFFKGKDVAVVGGGNSGVEAALDLSGIVNSVTILEFGGKLNADQVLLNKVSESPNIRTVTSAQTTRIESDGDKVTALVYKDRNSEKEESLSLDGVFVQIGLVPNSSFVKDILEVNRSGEIVVDEKCRTNVEGIFACGDVTQTPYKQIIIAMGEGAKAAISAFEYLLHKN
ncbi:alkyl hydroperoxide reductase subunit F [Leptospira idonii]|uniref:Alkyl hydroperoxide reductase subunit F n=1 Tax=Leptospira idonii TaxID=1193500 RepID=A0A4R9LXX2_9LEPT|nr:alkyl hydroperoxide reductase subunit F [Leptospira idonii]TGN17281.1 alkyl hydroperoxide reductase subunit F [Leptospira idonii]